MLFDIIWWQLSSPLSPALSPAECSVARLAQALRKSPSRHSAGRHPSGATLNANTARFHPDSLSAAQGPRAAVSGAESMKQNYCSHTAGCRNDSLRCLPQCTGQCSEKMRGCIPHHSLLALCLPTPGPSFLPVGGKKKEKKSQIASSSGCWWGNHRLRNPTRK